MKILIDGELVDTYGGDYTYRDVYYDIENEMYVFYETHYGAKSSSMEKIEDKNEIEEFLRILPENKLL